MLLKGKDKRLPNIPTASMGDIAFLIIIFFMVSTVFTRDKGIKMLLPERTTQNEVVQVKPENIVMILINPEGALRIKAAGYQDGLELAQGQYDELRKIIEEKLLERDTMLVVSLRTSKDTPYKNMIAVLDQIKLAKVTIPHGRELRANKISLIPTSAE